MDQPAANNKAPPNDPPPRLPPPAPRLFSRQPYASNDRSFRSSSSSSSEADDERSTSDSLRFYDDYSGRMSPEDGGDGGGDDGAGADGLNGPAATLRYPGEDTRPTSNKELAGWYMYSFAAETYVICGQYL